MISKRIDYSSLLDNLRDFSNNYYLNNNGEVINKAGEIQNDESIIINTKFYILYCMAYKAMDETNENKPNKEIDKQFINRALASYGMFNYFLNNCIGEYRIYDEIGTGNITYIPYQPLADFFFANDARKELLMQYLKHEAKEVFEEDNSKGRVKNII